MLHAEVTSGLEWSKACSSAFVPLRVCSAGPAFRASLKQLTLAPDVTLTQVTSHASEVVRDSSVIYENPRDDVLLSLQLRGSGTVTQHGRAARLTPGSCALYDAGSPYSLSFPGQMSEIVLQLPRATLAHSSAEFEQLTARILPPSSALRGLFALAGSVTTAAQPHNTATDEAIAEALASLLQASLTLSRAHDAPPLEAELLAVALQLHIDEHASQPDFTPEALAASFHISLRYAQKLFAKHLDTGVASYIRQRRLETAADLLRAHSTVADAARRSGFVDVDSFSRAFKREYGVTPSRMSDAGLPSENQLT